MIEGFERGIYIYHSSMTAPFGDLALHLQDCCGGCPYCIECCQRAVDEANEIMGKVAPQCTCHIGPTLCKLHPKPWSAYMRTEGYKEYNDGYKEHNIPRTEPNPLAPNPFGENSETAYVLTGCGHNGIVKVQGDPEAVAAHVSFVKAHAEHMPWDCQHQQYQQSEEDKAAHMPIGIHATLPRDMGESHGIVSSGGGWLRDIAGWLAGRFFS